MKTKQWTVLLSLFVSFILFFAARAEATNGTLKFIFKYTDSATGVEQNLTSAFAYFRSASKPPPMEKYFSKADYILGGSSASGTYQISVPEGTYYLRITQRKLRQGAGRQYGPPEAGDYTWVRRIPITITANQVLDLGTIYATPFALAPITITGTVKNLKGVPLAGQYVRAQTEPCIEEGWSGNINRCGPVKDLALQPTDTGGRYTLQLKEPGTYYIYSSPCLTASYDPYTGNRCGYTQASGPVTVTRGDSMTVDITVRSY